MAGHAERERSSMIANNRSECNKLPELRPILGAVHKHAKLAGIKKTALCTTPGMMGRLQRPTPPLATCLTWTSHEKH